MAELKRAIAEAEHYITIGSDYFEVKVGGVIIKADFTEGDYYENPYTERTNQEV